MKILKCIFYKNRKQVNICYWFKTQSKIGLHARKFVVHFQLLQGSVSFKVRIYSEDSEYLNSLNSKISSGIKNKIVVFWSGNTFLPPDLSVVLILHCAINDFARSNQSWVISNQADDNFLYVA